MGKEERSPYMTGNMDADLYNQYMTFSEAAGDDFDGVFASMKIKVIFLHKEHIIVQ
jgi:hypothetical protein